MVNDDENDDADDTDDENETWVAWCGVMVEEVCGATIDNRKKDTQKNCP